MPTPSTDYPAGRSLLDVTKATRAELFMEAQWLADHGHHGTPYAEKVNEALRVAQGGAAREVFDVQGSMSKDLTAKLDAELMSAAVKGAVEDVGGPTSPENVQRLIRVVCNEVCEMLLQKNRSYGNSAIDPVRIFSRASPREQIRVRIDDKLSRMARGTGEMNEDTEFDMLGYLILDQVAARIERATREQG